MKFKLKASSALMLVSQFSWPDRIDQKNLVAAPVDAFKHAPLADYWNQLNWLHVYVEVATRNPPPAHLICSDAESGADAENISHNNLEAKAYFWPARVVQTAGYLAKLRYVGLTDETAQDFWVHLCDTESVHRVGWAAENGHSLVPPWSIAFLKDDWHAYFDQTFPGMLTLPRRFEKDLEAALKGTFKKGMMLELVDKKKVSCMRIGRVLESIGGRLQLKYEFNGGEFEDFWCHQASPLIHPTGWSVTVGHEIVASENYKKESAEKYQKNERKDYAVADCRPNMFKQHRKSNILEPFRVNMKLEAIDPLNLSVICVATVAKVLKNDYLMIKIDGVGEKEAGLDMFCYHRNSPSIFPAGFCQKHNLPLQAPYNYKGKFDWENYLRETKSEFAPVDLFYKDDNLKNRFRVGMKLESVDLMEPRMVCVATVKDVVDRLLKIGFDGWDQSYDQWVDCESCDIFPVGWCQLVGYKLEDPPINE